MRDPGFRWRSIRATVEGPQPGTSPMTASDFACSDRFAKGLPPPAPRWTGFAKHNFIGGHNDPAHIPGPALAEAATAVLRQAGTNLALYNCDGPQGFRALREFVVRKVAGRP